MMRLARHFTSVMVSVNGFNAACVESIGVLISYTVYGVYGVCV